MRKIFTFSFLTAVFVLLSGPALAGKVAECEAIKHDPEYKGLYGLCNAYWNADEESREAILRNFEKKAGPGGPSMPGLVSDPDPDDDNEPVVCPCWDYKALEQELACGPYAVVFSGIDETGDGSGEDFALFSGPSFIQVFAGNTSFDQVPESNECNIVAPAAFTVESFSAVTGSTEDQCRLDVLDLILAAGNLAMCEQ